MSNEELAIERKASEQEKQLLDLEALKVTNEENFIAQAEIESQQNEIRRQQEIANAEQTGADISLSDTNSLSVLSIVLFGCAVMLYFSDVFVLLSDLEFLS